MRLQSGYEKKRSRVEMIPLIDVVFLLLVFFMYAMLSMTVHRGLKVELEETSNAEVDRRDFVNLTVTGEHEIYLDGEAVSLGALAVRIGEKQAAGEGRPVLLSGDERARHGLIVKVLDTLRGAGVRDVVIESEEEGR